ncbi:MAG: Mu transposase C-terminal domain-containing protein [Anaerocolumna sp.]
MIYYREGEKAFNDALVSTERSREDIDSNDIWFSDHHLVDVAVINNRGRVFRPWLTVFFDARASKVISFIVRDKSADATVIKQCLRIGMEQHGVPKELYFDNGKDYREKSFNSDFPISLVKQLGINMIYATPYHGQAKTVERFFGTMEDRFCKFIPTYLGKDAKQRPENMRVTFDKLKDKAPTMEKFIELLTAYFEEYNHTPSNGIDMNGKCPEQVYYENLHTKNEVRDKSILRILCGIFDERTVQKNGVQYQGRFYYHTELLSHLGEKVIINADPYNMDELNVFDTDMRAICKAPAKVRTPFRHTTQEQFREAMKEKKEAKKMIQRYAPTRELDTMSIIARNQMLEKQYEEMEGTKIVENINPALSKNSRILESSVQSRRLSDEDNALQAITQIKHA